MNRWLRVFIIIAIVIAVVLLAWRAKTAAHVVFASGNASASGPVAGSNAQTPVALAAANSLAAIKRVFTGGVGLQLTMDGSAGLPKVAGVLRGSPAESAGLRAGDLILKVDEQATAGQTLAQVTEEMRGLTLGPVTLTVQRPGSTNLVITMSRSSWNSLGLTNMYSAPTNRATR